MTDRRRFQGVASVLALAAVISLSHVWGEPTREPAADKLRTTATARAEAGFTEEDLAASKFASSPVVTYQNRDGQTLFALQVQPRLDPVPVRPRDYAVLIDTSASQARGPLAVSVKLTEALLKSMGSDDRVAVFTVNTTTRELTRGLRASRDAQGALKVLQDEYPSGAANLKQGVETALKCFELREGRQQVILYMGDGMSILDPISSKDRTTLAQDMVRKQVQFCPVPLGPRMEPANLHGFATATGGAPVRIRATDKPEEVLKRLEEVVAAPVLYPTRFELTGDVAESFPARMPPLRADVPTLVIGKLSRGGTVGYKVTGDVAGSAVTRTHEEKLPEADADNYFLVGMLDQWREDKQAAALIRADRALAYALEQNQLARADLAAQAELAIAKDQYEAAIRLFEQVRQLNPHDIDAKHGLDIVKKLRDGTLTKDQLEAKLQPKPDDTVVRISKGKSVRERLLARQAPDDKAPKPPTSVIPPSAPPGTAPIAPAEGPRDILKEAKERQAVEDQRTTRVVEDAIKEAQKELRANPDAAIDRARRALDGVQNNPDLSERARTELSERLRTALRNYETQGRQIKRELEDRMARAAQVRYMQERNNQERAAQELIQERMRLYRAYMNQGRDEEAARLANDIRLDLRAAGRDIPVAVTAAYGIALASHNLREIEELRRVREERFLLTMLQVEKSHVPFPDEPPVQFPPTASWKELSRLRKDRYESSTLGEEDPALLKRMKDLKDLLSRPVKFPGIEADPKITLQEVLDLLAERYEVTFDVNEGAFREAMLMDVLDQKVAEKAIPKMFGVSLGTVLQKILSRIALQNGDTATYIIRREAIEITTGLRARTETVTRVYPVADLVYPILDNGTVIPTDPFSFNQQAIFGGFGFNGGIGLPGGFPGAGVPGVGGLGGFPGAGFGFPGAFPGAGFPGAAGFGGFPGGGFTPPGQTGPTAGGNQQSQDLVLLIRQVIGSPRDWAPLTGVNAQAQAGLPGIPMQEPDPQNTPGGWDLGYYPPARALLIKAPSRLHSNFAPVGPSGGPPGLMGAAEREDKDIVRIAKGNKAERNAAVVARAAADKAAKPEVKDTKPVVVASRPPKADADPRAVWEEALTKGVDDPGLVIACADYMVQAGKYDHAAEFLKANLRRGIVVRPWVYSALAIALKESKASAEEVERAEVAASDLEPLDAQGFVKASQAMASQKRYDRALAYCRQAALLEPSLVTAYQDALSYASQVKNAEAMEWAAGNLLSRDWPTNGPRLHQEATDQLSALARKLDKEQLESQAESLRAALKRSHERDLVIKMSWAGQANLDLRVAEPCGSVCSWLNRQTIGGGTLRGDTLGDASEEYSAAQAFAGDYKITVDTVWGKPTGDTVKIEVTIHRGTPDEVQRIITLDLRKSKSVTVKLDSGRRTETAPVPPPGAAPTTEALAEESSSDVMSRLRTMADPSSTPGPTGLRGGVGSLGRPAEPRPVIKAASDTKRDQVVYQTRVQPFVTNGSSMSAQAIVSADQREVRLRLAPYFQAAAGQQPVVNNPLIPGGKTR